MASKSRIRQELDKFSKHISSERRRKYFLWKHGINTLVTDYKNMTEEEFINWVCQGKKNIYERLKRWEETQEYKHLEYLYRSENFDDDLLEVYEAIKEEAKKGNSSAVKSFLELQKIIKNKIKNYDKETEEQQEDDGLTLDV